MDVLPYRYFLGADEVICDATRAMIYHDKNSTVCQALRKHLRNSGKYDLTVLVLTILFVMFRIAWFVIGGFLTFEVANIVFIDDDQVICSTHKLGLQESVKWL